MWVCPFVVPQHGNLKAETVETDRPYTPCRFFTHGTAVRCAEMACTVQLRHTHRITRLHDILFICHFFVPRWGSSLSPTHVAQDMSCHAPHHASPKLHGESPTAGAPPCHFRVSCYSCVHDLTGLPICNTCSPGQIFTILEAPAGIFHFAMLRHGSQIRSYIPHAGECQNIYFFFSQLRMYCTHVCCKDKLLSWSLCHDKMSAHCWLDEHVHMKAECALSISSTYAKCTYTLSAQVSGPGKNIWQNLGLSGLSLKPCCSHSVSFAFSFHSYATNLALALRVSCIWANGKATCP